MNSIIEAIGFGAMGAVYGTDASPEMIEVAQKKASQSGANVLFEVVVLTCKLTKLSDSFR